MEAASNRHAPGLFLFWSLASGAAAYMAVQQVSPDLVLLLDATFWLGVVSSISLMEAWVKFRAPLLERWVGVDAGRRVFMGQFAMEGALALTSGAMLYAKTIGGSDGVQGGLQSALAALPGQLLVAAGAILLLDAGLLFPALNLRGKHMIVASAQPDRLSPVQREYVAELARGIEGRTNPPPTLHLLAVLLAFARAGLLAAFIWEQMLLLA